MTLAADILALSPAKYYTFDNVGNRGEDLGANARDLSIAGATISYVATTNGWALSTGAVAPTITAAFNYVEAADSVVEVFFRIKTSTSINNLINSSSPPNTNVTGLGGPNVANLILQSTTATNLVIGHTTYADIIAGSFISADGNWHDYVVRMNGTNLRGYRDGALVNNSTILAATPDLTAGVFSLLYNTTNAEVDDIGMWHGGAVQLDDTTISNLHTSALNEISGNNTQPTTAASNIAFVGGIDTRNATLTAAWTFVDPDSGMDGQHISSEVEWYQDSGLGFVLVQTDSLGAVLTSNYLTTSEKTDQFYYRVRVRDNSGEGNSWSNWSTSNTITIQNTPGTLTSATVTPASPLTTDTLTCAVVAGDVDPGDTATPSYQWQANVGAGWNPLVGQTASTLAAPLTNGTQYRCFVTVVFSDGTANATLNSNSVTATNQVVVNTPPSITSVPANQTINSGASTGALAFTITDAETPVANLVMTATSSNQAVIPDANITLGGAGGNRTIDCASVNGQSGVVIITMVCTDTGGSTDTKSFSVTVNPPAPGAITGDEWDLSVIVDDSRETYTLTDVPVDAFTGRKAVRFSLPVRMNGRMIRLIFGAKQYTKCHGFDILFKENKGALR